MPLSGGPRQILAALPVVAAQPSIISTDARKHPVPTAQETPQPHRREDPCPPSIPALASSTTIHLSAGTSTREAASRYTSGSGLPQCTSSADTMPLKMWFIDRASSTASMLARGAAEAIACRHPYLWSLCNQVATPGSGAMPPRRNK